MGSDETGGGSSVLKTVATLTAFITALAGLIGVLHQTGMLGGRSDPPSSPPADHAPPPASLAVADTQRPLAPAPREAPLRDASSAPSRVSRPPIEPSDTVERLVEPEVAPSPRRTTIPNIAGTWLEPSGSTVIIDQHGRDVTLRIPMVEQMGVAMGIAPALTMLTGTIQQDDSEGTAVTAANNLMPMRAQYRLSADGRRLDGTVTNQYTSVNSTLIKP